MRNVLTKFAKLLGIGERVAAPVHEHVPSHLDDISFWYIVDRCNDLSATNESYYNTLWSILSEVDDAGVAGFAVKVEELRRPLQSWDNWAAANLLFPGLPHDAYHGFQNWIISSGKKPYHQALEQADNIVDVIDAAGHRELVFDIFDRIPAEILSTRPRGEHFRVAATRSSDAKSQQGVHWELTSLNYASRLPKLWAIAGEGWEAAAAGSRPAVH